MSKCKSGDKVRITSQDVNEECEFLEVGDIVEIEYVLDDYEFENNIKYFISGYTFDDGGQYYLYEDEFKLVKESVESDKKYTWYLDSEDSVYFLNEYTDVVKLNKKHYTTEIEKTKNGENVGYLLTEEQAKQSPFFDKFTKHDPFEEKWYYIRMKGNVGDYLNLDINDGEYFMNDGDECDSYKTKFTEEECNEIVGTSSILYKELVK